MSTQHDNNLPSDLDDLPDPPTVPDAWIAVDWTKQPPDGPFDSEAQGLVTLQYLGDELGAARKQVDHIMRYMTAAVRATRATVEDGQPVSKQAIIRESGLARRTVYRMLGEAATTDPRDLDTADASSPVSDTEVQQPAQQLTDDLGRSDS